MDDTRTHWELKRLLREYSISGVVDLFELYDALDGGTIDSTYHSPSSGSIGDRV